MADIVVTPATGSDDATWYASTYDNTSGWLAFGLAGGTTYKAVIRFTNVAIAPGSTISAASVTLTGYDNLAAALDAEILAVAADDAAMPADAAAADALSLGTASPWNSVGATTVGVDLTSASVATSIQEIINRPGWVSGNSIVLVIRAVSPAADAYRQFYTVENVNTPPDPRLSITYTEPPPPTGDLDDTLPAITLLATNEPAYLLGELPALSATASGVAGEIGAASMVLPIQTSASTATNDGAIVALPQLVIEAYGGGDGVSANTLPLPSAQASGVTGTISTSSTTTPALLLDAHAGSYALLEIPITVEASGLAGSAAVATIQTPSFTLAAAASQEGVGAADLSIPRFTLAAAGLAENDSSLSEVLRPVRLVASGVVGYAGDVSIELPGIVLSAAAHTNNTATADNETPAWYIGAEAFSAIAEAYRAWALNVRNAALTEYSGMAFNSFGVFQGRVLAAGATGLHVVGETDFDNTTNIAALVRTAVTDFGTSYNKRVPRAYVGMKAAQDMEFRTITAQDGARAYLIPRNGNSEVQQRRAPIGRGPKARFWQFELANRDGGDFTAVDILVYPEVTYRRVV